eukprot:gene26298-32860_t
MYITDSTNNYIRKVSAGDQIIRTIAGLTNGPATSLLSLTAGSGLLTSDQARATSSLLSSPSGVWVDTQNNVYISEQMSNKIRKVTNGVIATVAGGGSSTLSNIQATSAFITAPQQLFGDTAQSLFAACSGDWSVRKLSLTSSILTTYAGTGSIGESTNTGQATSLPLYAPYGLWGDTTGGIVISDCGSQQVYSVSSSGVRITIAGELAVSSTSATAANGDNGPALLATFQNPIHVFLDTLGMIYVADSSNKKIRKLNPTFLTLSFTTPLTQITTVLGDGWYSNDPAGTYEPIHTSIRSPAGVWADTDGVLYVTEQSLDDESDDSWGNGVMKRIDGDNTTSVTDIAWDMYLPYQVFGADNTLLVAEQKIELIVRFNRESGHFHVVAGIFGGGWTNDDSLPATSTSLWMPTGVWSDTAGNIYLTEYYGDQIRRIDAITSHISVFGGIPGDDDHRGDYLTTAPATSTCISGPVQLFGDTVGNLFVAAEFDNVIRSINIATGWSTVIAGNTMQESSLDSGAPSLKPSALSFVTPLAQITTVLGDGWYVDDPPQSFEPPNTSIRSPAAVWADTSGVLFVTEQCIQSDDDDYQSGSGILKLVDGQTADSVYNFALNLTEPFQVFGISNTLLVAEFKANRVLRFNRDTADYVVVAGIFDGMWSNDDTGPATSVPIYSPGGVWSDTVGNVYLSEYYANLIRKVDAISGRIAIFAGVYNDDDGDYFTSGQATSVAINGPAQLYGDTAGNLFVSANNDHVVRIINIATGWTTVVAGNAYQDSSHDSGPATSTPLNSPVGVWGDMAGNTFISEFDGQMIKVVTTAGIVSTIAGKTSAGTAGDGGPVTSASFVGSQLFGDDSRLFVTSATSATIRVIDYAQGGGAITTSGTRATSYKFTNAGGISGDSSGNIYVSDSSTSSRIVVITTGKIWYALKKAVTAITVFAKLSAKGTVYCASYAAVSGHLTAPPASQAEILLQNHGAVTSSGNLSTVIISGLNAVSNYSVYCLAVSPSNTMTPLSTVLSSVLIVETACCKSLDLKLASTSITAGVDVLNYLSITLSSPPSNQIQVKISIHETTSDKVISP